jgi:hypothetical protein
MGKEYTIKTKEFFIGDLAADSDAIIYPFWTVPHAIKITAARLGVKTAVTKADTNYNTVTLKGGATSIAAIANGPNSAAGTSIAAGAFGTMTVVTAAGANEVAAATVMTLNTVKTGSGLAMVGVRVQIDYYDYNA